MEQGMSGRDTAACRAVAEGEGGRNTGAGAPLDTTVVVGAGPISVEIKRDLDLRPADAAAFDALIATRPDVGVFVSRSWLSGLFAEPPDGAEPMLMLFRDGDTLRGVVPIGILQTPTLVRIGLLGGGAGSDRVDLIAARGLETRCADALMRWVADTFADRGHVIELRDVPAGSPLWGAIQRVNDDGARRLAFLPRDVHTLPYLDLTESRNEALKSLEKHRRWLERRGRLRIDVLQDPAEALAAFDSLTSFLHARWGGHDDGSALDSPRANRFHRRVIPLLLNDGHLRMIRIAIDMRTVAVFYGVAIGNWLGYYLAGYDRAWAGRIHLGQITLAAAVDLAVREGVREFDFLKGVERVKYLWPVRERSAMDADAYSAHWGAQLDRAARAGRDAAAGGVKAARALKLLIRRMA
jgi:CelD/BcsL family acetyltransferase involved in cellulose biosynthesis